MLGLSGGRGKHLGLTYLILAVALLDGLPGPGAGRPEHHDTGAGQCPVGWSSLSKPVDSGVQHR